ncbi:hypothetical protein Agub_g13396 [Astrephomene gubernaculifera]|uniref:Uncharacterized protein n=1 Tax=Astrephomene gubernaculifera TaxID=47775 RepID=A0AAD3E236_9CHLO|nr:hypothetical protein Agub_g13396 [Astrephomene gubernaculifera]
MGNSYSAKGPAPSLPAQGTICNEWTSKEKRQWLENYDFTQRYREALSTDGHCVTAWDDRYLISMGAEPEHVAQLLAARDDMVARARVPPPQSLGAACLSRTLCCNLTCCQGKCSARVFPTPKQLSTFPPGASSAAGYASRRSAFQQLPEADRARESPLQLPPARGGKEEKLKNLAPSPTGSCIPACCGGGNSNLVWPEPQSGPQPEMRQPPTNDPDSHSPLPWTEGDNSGTEDTALQLTTTVSAPGVVPPLQEPSGEQQTSPDTSTKHWIWDALEKGVHAASGLLQAIAPMIPHPGDKAAKVLRQIFLMLDGCVTNKKNIMELAKHATVILDILDVYKFKPVDKRQMKRVVGDFVKLLEDVKEYAIKHEKSWFIWRTLRESSYREEYQDYVARLETLKGELMMLVQMDTNIMVHKDNDMFREAVRRFIESPQYTDPAAEAKKLVKELGGIDAVQKDGVKMEQVCRELGISDQLEIAMLLEVKSKLAEIELRLKISQPSSTGLPVYQRIKQPILRIFWGQVYGNESQVPWPVFFKDFPTRLKGELSNLMGGATVITELEKLLSEKAGQDAFLHAVERYDPNHSLCVYELEEAFDSEDLLPQVASIVENARLTPIGGASATAAPAGHQATTTGQPFQDGMTAPQFEWNRQLPPVPPQFTSREVEAAEIKGRLLTSGSLVLVGPEGVGKSCLAADVGRRLMREGCLPGGVRWVPLARARSAMDVKNLFCIALGIPLARPGVQERILKAIQKLAGNKGGDVPPMAALLIIDHAEDAFREPEAQEVLMGLLSEVRHEARAVRVLITSCTSLNCEDSIHQVAAPGSRGTSMQRLAPLDEYFVTGFNPAVSRSQITKLADQAVADKEVDAVAAACHNNPLALNLVTHALAAGVLSIQELPSPFGQEQQLQQHTEATDSDQIDIIVKVVLGRLLRREEFQALAQLSVFPSTFDIATATHVLGITKPKAERLLQVLQGYGLIQLQSPQQYIMQSSVKLRVAQLGDPLLLAQAEERFAVRTVQLLLELAAMYQRPNEEQLAMSMGTRHWPDLLKSFQLLNSMVCDKTPLPSPLMQSLIGAAAVPVTAIPAESNGPDVEGHASCEAQPFPVQQKAGELQLLSGPVNILAKELGMLHLLEESCQAIVQQLDDAGASDGSGKAPSPLQRLGVGDRDRLEAMALATLVTIHTDKGQLEHAQKELDRCVDKERSMFEGGHMEVPIRSAGLQQALLAAKVVVAAATERPDLQPRIPKTREEELLLQELRRDAAFDSAKIAALLADPTLNPNIQHVDGSTPLMLACKGENADIVDALLKAGADVDAASEDGVTPLHLACKMGTYRIVNSLIEAGADVNAETENGISPLFIASCEGMYEVVHTLIAAGSDIHKRDKGGWTTLMAACSAGLSGVAKRLIYEGVDIHAISKDGKTALVLAAAKGHACVVQMLLKEGACKGVYSLEGSTALLLASSNGYKDIVEMLLQAGAKHDLANSEGSTALLLASSNGYKDIVEMLLQAGAKHDLANSAITGPALVAASARGHSEVVCALMNAGADPNIEGPDGLTPLQAAEKEGNDGFVRLLLMDANRPPEVVHSIFHAPSPLFVAAACSFVDAYKLKQGFACIFVHQASASI